ncbi:ubiquinol-cytochrome c reductase iron-sulfur subunit [Rhodovastum atsumiense]|uniref:Ubiquinol-cytochrome c reductase iron-sulfur subunit n=2 Tax=Rhodovastum atsumiense TaxID=504468 RepID=A0A5M6IKL1_9PROT|nr:ubiquinol-cytochrome c reductase iron-sulfur subunit [Rhodovastum atsumiense]KAA5608419.1 ubiquinol-cytochrome c reductase iron-sulfur subunit [Rhodovastum atsumiense]
MADTMSGTAHASGHGSGQDVNKRDFLKLVAGASAAIGVGAIAWPLVDSMNPSKDVLALSELEVDLAPIAAGQAIIVSWRGSPVFVRHRTATEIKEAESAPMADLKDPQTDEARVKKGHEEWLIVSAVCTHLGCIPLGAKPTDPRGEFGGWFCPCHGSQYDTSGRIRKGPAPANLPVPPYAFLNDTKIKIG